METKENKPGIPPLYDRPNNIQHKMEPAEAASDEKIRAAGEYIIKKHMEAL